jgi:ribosomal protein S18 acetylase RimI-like enzyme
LADLRYNEWILQSNDDDGNNSSSDDDTHSHSHHRPPPSRSSFRLATSEIYHERTAEGSTVFLAMMTEEEVVDSNHDGDDIPSQRVVAVGAAELSPIELKGVFNEKDHAAIVDIIKPMYITDVVTSSSYRHRGIGSNLMHFIENYAWMEKGTRIVYLHVAMENVGAKRFYERLGYRDAVVVVNRRLEEEEDENENDECAKDSNNSQVGRRGGIESSSLVEVDGVEHECSRKEDGITSIDYDRLAENAGTVGQILMMKRLSGPTVDERHHVTTTSAATFQSLPDKSTISGGGGGGGFGRPKAERRRKR